MRKLIHRKETYLWKRAHYHLDNSELSKCSELVVIYLESFKNSPIKLHFREEDSVLINSRNEKGKWMVGYPDSGVIWFSDTGKTAIHGENSDCKQINLNRPAIIIKLIDYYLSNGWKPKSTKQSFVVNNALEILEFIDFPREKTKTTDTTKRH